jgi:2',3'-cyclic-nucleotide 2'-phosphodiesterase (5'-nucleotidase family)
LLGGLARRVAYAKKMRMENQATLLVDSGDLFFAPLSGGEPERGPIKAQIIGRAYRSMRAAAVNVGDLDLLRGIDFLRKEYTQGLPLISANLLDSSRKAPIFPPFAIKEVSGIRVAFLGLLSPDFRSDETGLAVKIATDGKIFIKDPMEAARETVQKLKGRADVTVLLSDLGLQKDRLLAQAVPGIHFILGGHEGRYIHNPFREGMTYIAQSSAKNMYVGQLRLMVQTPNSPFRAEGEVQQIQEKINQLDSQLQNMQKAKAQSPGQNTENIDRALQEVTRQKNILREELKRAKDSAPGGNRFSFSVEPLEGSHPEDEEVREWMAEAGIDKD